MKLARVVMVATVLATATATWAQKSDFSGTWTLDPASASDGGGGGEFALGPMTVKQTAEVLTIERTMGDATATLTYKLDGSPSRNVLAGPSGQEVDIMSTVVWDGAKLTIVGKREMRGQIIEGKQVWSVEGNTLTVVSTGPRGTQKRVYRR